MKDKPIVLLGTPPKPPMLAPGLHTCRVIAIDQAKGEDFMAGIIAKMSVNGSVVIEHMWQLDNLAKPIKLKAHSHVDMFEFPYSLPRKGDRHHKRKPQPNRGPVGRNQWN